MSRSLVHLEKCVHEVSALKTTRARAELDHAGKVGEGMAGRQAGVKLAGEGLKFARLGAEFIAGDSGEVGILIRVVEHGRPLGD